MIKKFLSTALATMMVGSSLADDVPALKISKSDGESLVVLSELLSIKFTESEMVVNMKDGTKQVFSLDDVMVMELGQTTPSDISSIIADSDINAICTITDINGKVVAKGKLADGNVLPSRKGLYILTVGDKSKKIFVK